jgi:hypothetical protein
LKLAVASEDDIDSWLKEFKLESLEKTSAGNWGFIQKSGDSAIQVSIMYSVADPSKLPMIGVGCLFMYTVSQETKFCLVTNGAIMLITHRSAVDLDQSELKEMIENVISMYDQFHEDCLKIVS